MRDSYYAPPVRDVIDTLVASHALSAGDDAHLFSLSWELELLLLDEQSPERQWRHALAEPLRRLQQALRELNLPRELNLDLAHLIRELAY